MQPGTLRGGAGIGQDLSRAAIDDEQVAVERLEVHPLGTDADQPAAVGRRRPVLGARFGIERGQQSGDVHRVNVVVGDERLLHHRRTRGIGPGHRGAEQVDGVDIIIARGDQKGPGSVGPHRRGDLATGRDPVEHHRDPVARQFRERHVELAIQPAERHELLRHDRPRGHRPPAPRLPVPPGARRRVERLLLVQGVVQYERRELAVGQTDDHLLLVARRGAARQGVEVDRPDHEPRPAIDPVELVGVGHEDQPRVHRRGLRRSRRSSEFGHPELAPRVGFVCVKVRLVGLGEEHVLGDADREQPLRPDNRDESHPMLLQPQPRQRRARGDHVARIRNLRPRRRGGQDRHETGQCVSTSHGPFLSGAYVNGVRQEYPSYFPSRRLASGQAGATGNSGNLAATTA